MEVLQKYYEGKEGETRTVVQRLRPVLECYCRHVCPGKHDRDTLGVIVGKIRDDGPNHPMYENLVDLDEINEYCRPYHHGENGKASTEPINETELVDYIKRTLKIAGCIN